MPASGPYSVSFSETVGSVLPANLDGDELTDWVAEMPLSFGKGTYRIEARNHFGDLLWKFDSGLDGMRMTANSHCPLVAWDFDGDGRDEVVTLKYGYTDRPPVRAFIVALDGETGKEKAITPVPWAGGTGNSRYNHATTRSYSTIAYLDGPDRPPSYVLHLGTYGDGVCWAFDLVDGSWRMRWDYQHVFWLGTGHHGLKAFDIDGDGRDEILMGGTVIDADGCKVFSFTEKEGYGHVDFVIPEVIDPEIPGVQLLFGFEFGYGVAMTNHKGEVYWKFDDVYHAHSGWVAKVHPDVPGKQIRMNSKLFSRTWVYDGSPPDLTRDKDRTEPWRGMFDAKGRQIDMGPFHSAKRPPDWNGDGIHVPWEQVMEELGLGEDANSWGGLTGCDLGGGPNHGAEEIIQIRENTVRVHFNRKAQPSASKWMNTNYRRMALSSLASGYRNYDTYTVWHSPVKKLPPTAFATVDGQRNIGVRSQETVDGVRVLKGKKFVLFRDAVHQFRGSSSWDGRGRPIRSTEWDWGDGTYSRETDPVKRFEKNGTYACTLTIRSGRRVSREHFTVEIQELVLNYVARTPHVFSIKAFDEGSPLYIDQEAHALDVPEALKGMTLIRTHHHLEGNRAAMLFSWDLTQVPSESITFRVPVEMEVNVAMDEFQANEPAINRYTYYNHEHPHGPDYRPTYWPEWIGGDGWQRTDLSVVNSMNGRRHVLYRKNFKPGQIVRLGPNRYDKAMVGDLGRNMYFVLLAQRPRLFMDDLFA